MTAPADPPPSDPAPPILVPVGAGELIDKLTILAIKLERIADPAKRENVRREHTLLSETRARAIGAVEGLDALEAELKAVNEALWEIEDAIRERESEGDFGDRFVALARAVYRENDRRAALKKAINCLTGSAIVEEKSYAGS
ncbi:MAG: DUF6165 family protein [Azospirillaceae bacterium]